MAGDTDRKVITTAKKECPIICWRTAKSESSWLCWWKCSISWFCLPNSLASMIPDTERVSWVTAVTSAIATWDWAATLRRRAPTHLVRTKNTGAVATATTVSCQESISMAIRVLVRITTLAMVSETVLVTTVCTPPTSLEIRDWTSPVLVPVKNPRDIPCRWA